MIMLMMMTTILSVAAAVASGAIFLVAGLHKACLEQLLAACLELSHESLCGMNMAQQARHSKWHLTWLHFVVMSRSHQLLQAH